MPEIQIGDVVTFQQQYGRGYLKAIGDEWGIAYRRRTSRGIVRQILKGERFPTTVLIEVEGAGRYQGLVGIPLEKVKKKELYGQT